MSEAHSQKEILEIKQAGQKSLSAGVSNKNTMQPPKEKHYQLHFLNRSFSDRLFMKLVNIADSFI